MNGVLVDYQKVEIPMDVLSIAGEYDITPLKDLATAHWIETITECAGDINLANFKDIVQLAHLHGNHELKDACFQFIKKNPVSVLMNAEIMNLSNEDPAFGKSSSQESAPVVTVAVMQVKNDHKISIVMEAHSTSFPGYNRSIYQASPELALLCLQQKMVHEFYVLEQK
jgi:hypothetical protein